MKFITSIILTIAITFPVTAQDTLSISLEEFVEIALQNAGQVKVAQVDVSLAENRKQRAKDQRFLPSLNFRSEHALVPGVTSPNGRPEESIYLDPDARNDWSNFGLFTRLRVSGVQPVFTWGAVGKAVNAAELGIKAMQQQTVATEEETKVLLNELYYSYVLALEIERLLKDAEDKMDQIERAMKKQEEEDPAELDESDMFKFRVFKAQFGIQREEVKQSLLFVKESWEYALRNEDDNIYEPSVRFLDPIDSELSEINYYQNSAMVNRAELKAINFGRDALKTYIGSLKAQNLPGLYLGFTTTLASTPIRPRQPNPFIQTPENTFNTAVGFTIRQNLNFFQAKTNLERSRLEVRRLEFLEDAATDGIILELNEAYRTTAIAKAKVERTDEALQIAKEWLRAEQLDYDLGFGDSKDLIDAVRQELELRLTEKQSIFEFNTALIKLNKSAGLPLTHRLDQ
ncbi:MAG: TolC family protein [bacterium]|nr:TolC family protein [bacterium]